MILKRKVLCFICIIALLVSVANAQAYRIQSSGGYLGRTYYTYGISCTGSGYRYYTCSIDAEHRIEKLKLTNMNFVTASGAYMGLSRTVENSFSVGYSEGFGPNICSGVSATFTAESANFGGFTRSLQYQ